MPAAPPQTARRHYAESAYLAQKAAHDALEARPRGIQALAGVVMRAQVQLAQRAQWSVGQMLLEQEIDEAAEAILSSLAFTTPADSLDAMTAAVDTDVEFQRLVASIVQSAGRAAESVSVTARPNVSWVRYLNLPSCSRCAVLAGREYRYSEGFLRHPGCDCVMLPVTVASPDFVHDPVELAKAGQVTGLSRADIKALHDGADMSRIVNVRRKSAGLLESGRAIQRGGRPTPEAIYRFTSTREEAVQALIAAGYLVA